MSFILAANRDNDSIDEARKNWDDYQAHLEALRDRFPVSAYEIATSNWRYDEFSLTDEGNLLHTIEWADGALWVIEASDLEHRHIPDSTENQQAQVSGGKGGQTRWFTLLWAPSLRRVTFQTLGLNTTQQTQAPPSQPPDLFWECKAATSLL